MFQIEQLLLDKKHTAIFGIKQHLLYSEHMKTLSELVDPAEWKNDFTRRVGQNVREYRSLLGLSAQELSDLTAENAGYRIPRSTISNLEREGGKKTISAYEVSILASALDIPISYLQFSALHPSRDVQPYPLMPPLPTYVLTKMQGSNFQSMRLAKSRLTLIIQAVERLRDLRDAIMQLRYEISSSQRNNLDREITPLYPEIDSEETYLKVLFQKLSAREKIEPIYARKVEELGAEPWDLDQHYSLVTLTENATDAWEETSPELLRYDSPLLSISYPNK